MRRGVACASDRADGLLYGLLSSLPLIFEGVHGQSPGIAGLNFWAIAVGATGAMVTNILLFRRYLWLYPKWQGNVPTEERLCVDAVPDALIGSRYGAMIGGPILVISILWLGWTGAYASISWVAPMLSLSMMGLGMSCIFRKSDRASSADSSSVADHLSVERARTTR